MRGFTRKELLGVGAIFLILGGFSYLNFMESKEKERDEGRKAAARLIANALESYHKDFGVFPPSRDGYILACHDPKNVEPCIWGRDKLQDLNDPKYEPYLDPIPLDPRYGQGNSFYYVSSLSEFQVFAHLERRTDPEWSEYVDRLDLPCGQERCNYGITLSRRPVTKFLEEKQ